MRPVGNTAVSFFYINTATKNTTRKSFRHSAECRNDSVGVSCVVNYHERREDIFGKMLQLFPISRNYSFCVHYAK